MQLPLAVTLGEPAGIGPDLILKLWHERSDRKIPPFYIIGDPEFLARRAQQLGLATPIRVVEPSSALQAFSETVPVVPLGMPVTAEPGKPDTSSARAAITSIRRAVGDVSAGVAAALVTNPVSKAVLYRDGFPDPGHTEFLARVARESSGVSARPVMMLWSPELAVVPVTIHVALREVPRQLTSDLIVETARVVVGDMVRRFSVARPRIVVTGLNPHAGEDGALGTEEENIIAPALAQLRAEGVHVRGPVPADSLFHARARAEYDVALCMYHDQALIPIKTLAFDHAVNVTLGLPFVRTSPDHGTAFGVAGTGRGNAESLAAALKLASKLAVAEAASLSAPVQ